jgi:squalene cyclase
MAAWLLKQQSKDGSWQGDGVGTVYGTGIALTILQLPYSYAPIYQR